MKQTLGKLYKVDNCAKVIDLVILFLLVHLNFEGGEGDEAVVTGKSR